ncbi:glycosyltransferase [Streptomyces scopuliridis]|uniref:glycosyltransferase n=1 Tax=Streptomyces scopuliridis TaxID=452529 RepID=UPI0036B981CD
MAARVRAFAVDDGRRLTEGEREGGRAAFGIPSAEAAVCLVGGWWPHKDIDVIDQALARLREPLHLIVTGHPLDDSVLARWRALPNMRLHVEPGTLSEPILRLVYAAADAALVARHPGVGKESGLVMDAARYRVPLIVSDHDPDLTARLRDQPWARIFTTGDPASLASALEDLVRRPFDLPGPGAPKVLDMWTAAEQAGFLTRTALGLHSKEAGSGC